MDISAETQTQDKRTHTRADINQLIMQSIEKAQEAQKLAYEKWRNSPPEIKAGDKVWLETTNLSTNRPSPKLDWKRIGPLRVKEKLSSLMYQLELPSGYKIHDVFHISLLTPIAKDKIKGKTQPAPLPIQVMDPETKEPVEQYQIKRYLDSRWIKMKDKKWDFQFLVEWEGYDNHTWEPREQIEKDTKDSKQELGDDEDDFDLEEEFYSKHLDAPHHKDLEKERFEWHQKAKRRKGKAPIKQTRKT